MRCGHGGYSARFRAADKCRKTDGHVHHDVVYDEHFCIVQDANMMVMT